MRKIIFGLLFFVLFMQTVKGEDFYEIVKNDNGKLTHYTYNEKIINNKKAFLLCFDNACNNINEARINNLVYIANMHNSIEMDVVIQMYIWQSIYEDSTFYIKKNDNIINTYNIGEYIDNELQNIYVLPDFANKAIDVSYKSSINLKWNNIDFNEYIITNTKYDVNDNALILYSEDINDKKVEITPKKLNVMDNYVISNTIYLEKFYVYLNVLYNEKTLNIKLPNNETDYEFIYGIYDEYDNLIETFNINYENNKIYYAKNKKLYLKDLSSSDKYELSDNILLTDDVNDIEIKKEYTKYKINIKTFLYDYKNNQELENTNNYFDVYDSNNNFLFNIKNLNVIELEYGDYYFVDKISNYQIKCNVYENNDCYLKRYAINGFIFNNPFNIQTFCDDYNCYLFEANSNLLTVGGYLIPKIELFKINNTEIKLDLCNNDNYVYLENTGLFFKIDISFEDNEEIIIDIPNTFIKYNEEKIYYVKKEEYNIYFNNICSTV